MWNRKTLVIAIAAAAWCAPTQACGPFFPQELLPTRAVSLLELPEGNFAYEAQHLVVAGDALRANEAIAWDTTPDAVRDIAERAGLDAAQQEALRQARVAPDADAAYFRGDGLPAAARQYVAGAVAFAQAQYDLASERFRAVLALPAAERASRGVWAAYMLGRSEYRRGEIDAARAAFAQARALALAGDADPLGLAVASYGEEGRIALDTARVDDAIGAYAQQAARGSASGATSLLFVARRLVAEPDTLDAALASPLARRLLVAYAFSRAAELDAAGADESGEEPDLAGTDDVAAVTSPALETLLGKLATHDGVDGRDRLAALAYRAGRFDLAARFAQGDPSPLSAWLRAKLALRDGDIAGAAREYAAAAKAFPADERWSALPEDEEFGDEPVKPACRVAGEAGVLALSRGDYTEAMRALYRAADVYWADAAYVAERVLTTDELRAFVDAEVAAEPAPAGTDDALPPPLTPANQLRELLARRLLRDERRAEALAYFAQPERVAIARDYVAARDAADRAKGVDAAAQWWRAAVATREHGMELLGYELDPDYRIYDGLYDNNPPGRWDEATGEFIDEPRRDLVVTGRYTSDDERARVAASVASPLSRFHYRQVATVYAERAADLVPSRAQAYAAILCGATGWVLADDPARGHGLWRRYVKDGPYVPWAADFGHQCEEPDFAGAQARVDFERTREIKRIARRAAPYVAAVGALGLVLGGVWWFRRRRRG